KITHISVKDRTEALFYVQAPTKVDLAKDFTYQHTWVPMLQAASGCTPGGLPDRGGDWLKAFESQTPNLLARARELGFVFVQGARPGPNAQGQIPTTMEWCRKLTASDLKILTRDHPHTER